MEIDDKYYKYFLLSFTLFIVFSNVVVLTYKLGFLIGIVFSVLSIFFIKYNQKMMRIFSNFKLTKRSIFFMLCISFFIKVLLVLYLKNNPVSDFKVILNAAMQYNMGDFKIYKEVPYFIYWNYQIPFSLYESFILKIYNNNIILEIINCLVSTITTVPLYLLVNEIYGKKAAKISIIFYLAYSPFYYYNSLLTNQIIPICLVMFALYTYLKKKNFSCGIILGFSQLFRPIAIIVVIAVIMNEILNFLSKYDKKHIIRAIKVIVGYKIVLIIFSSYLIINNININGLNNSYLSNWKFLVGTNYESVGCYNNQDFEKVFSEIKIERIEEKDYNEFVEKIENINKNQIIEIKNRVLDIKKLSVLVIKKNILFWGGFDSGTGFIESDKYNKMLKIVFRVGEKIIYYFISMVLLLRSLNEIKINKKEKKDQVILISLIGYILIYSFIEIQVRYRFDIIYLIIILASNFFDLCTNEGSKC